MKSTPMRQIKQYENMTAFFRGLLNGVIASAIMWSVILIVWFLLHG